MKPSKKTKQKQLLTVRELKTWLDGYCSAHGKDWSPTPEQWHMIQDKIFNLNEDGDTSTPSRNQQGVVVAPYGGNVYTPQAPMASSTVELRPSLIGVTDQPAFVPSEHGALKTPNGESGGPSSFA